MKVNAADLTVVVPGSTVPRNIGLCIDKYGKLYWDNGNIIEQCTNTQYATIADRPSAASFGVGMCQIGGTVYASDGATWTELGAGGGGTALSTLASTTYNGDGTLASATINGDAWTFTYVAGKLATASKGGILQKTYTWSGAELISVS